jgi:hypothetical protein
MMAGVDKIRAYLESLDTQSSLSQSRENAQGRRCLACATMSGGNDERFHGIPPNMPITFLYF